jgi:hypothetical protein
MNGNNNNPNIEQINNYLNKEDDYILISNNLTYANPPEERKPYTNGNNALSTREIAVDTSDLIEDNSFDFEALKKNYLNNMISWTFLKKISEFNQWPLGCIGNLVENSLKSEVDARNIVINARCYDKKVYIKSSGMVSSGPSGLSLNECKDLVDKTLVMSIIDDGRGIPVKEFNQTLYSFSVNEKKEYNFFQFGVTMKASAIRLGNSFFIISKTENELSIGILSKNLQIKLSTDLILTPIVNYKIENDKQSPPVATNTSTTNTSTNTGNLLNTKYLPKSNFATQSLNLILNEVKFIFSDQNELFNYIETFETGTHIFIYDLRQITSSKNELNQIRNYELLFDYENKDILFNYFNMQIGERRYLDCSLKKYLRLMFIKQPNINLTLLDEKIDLTNPLLSLHNMSRNTHEAVRVFSNLKIPNDTRADCVYIEGTDMYKGVLFNENLPKLLRDSYSFNVDDLDESEIFNGVLLYRNNRLICRLEQHKLGDISYFIKKYEKMRIKEGSHVENINKIGEVNIFPISGYVELPAACFDLLYNKTVSIIL